ncbi:hypothetical protein Tco_0305605, partial [Tanacetum coccineum]
MDGASGLGRLPRWQLLGISGSGFKVRTGFRRGWVKDWVVTCDGEGFEVVAGKILRGELLLVH